MIVRSLKLALVGACVGAASVCAQTPAPTASATASRSVRSHVERFTSPVTRAEKTEADATAKLAANPNDAALLNARALARLQLGRYHGAAEDLRRAVTLHPSVSAYHANLGNALWRLQRFQEAINAEREALRLDERNAMAHSQLGHFLLFGGAAKQLPEAIAHLRRAIELEPLRVELRFDLLNAYRALGDVSQAVGQLQLLRDARPSDPRVTYAEALLSSDRGDLTEAINNFRETLRLDPLFYAAWQDLGLAYAKLKRWPEAVETFAELARRQTDSVEAAYFHALALFNAGQAEAAEREARRALRLNAGTGAAYTLLGIILASRGGADAEAAEALSQAVALDPASFDAQFYLGRVQYALRDYQAAVKALREATRLNARHAEARFFLGTALEAAGEMDAALVEYQELVRLDSQSAMGQVGTGALLVKQGKLDEAIAALKRAISLDPKIFEAQLALGRAFALSERFDEAIAALKAAVALAPERPDAHYQLGLALRRAGRTEEAALEFATVERINAEFRARTK